MKIYIFKDFKLNVNISWIINIFFYRDDLKIEAESTFSVKIPRPKQITNYEYDSLDQMKTYGVDYLEMGKFRIAVLTSDYIHSIKIDPNN